MENKKPIVLNNLEEWDFTDYIDSLIQKEEAVDLEFKIAKDGLPNSLWDTYSSFANTDGGVIISEGNGRGTKYHVNDPEREMGSSENNIDNSKSYMDNLEEEKVGSSEEKVGSSKRLKFEELQSIIISIAEDYITLDEIAKRTNRTFDYIANKIIPRMLKNGTIEYLYPGVPNHPKQKYKATNKKTNNKQ